MEGRGSGNSGGGGPKTDSSRGMDIWEREILWVEEEGEGRVQGIGGSGVLGGKEVCSEEKPPTFAVWDESQAKQRTVEGLSTPRGGSDQDTEYLISTGGLGRIRVRIPSEE